MNRLIQLITGTCLCLIVTLSTGTTAFADESHENPETAVTVFSGISLFSYYSDALDYVLLKSPEDVDTMLNRIPHAHVPEEIEASVAGFGESIIAVTEDIILIDADVETLSLLVQQSRFVESDILINKIKEAIPVAEDLIDKARNDVAVAGEAFEVADADPSGILRVTYDEVLRKLDEISELLSFYLEYTDTLGSQDSESQASLVLTEITLEIDPGSYFVGDAVAFSGRLAANERALTGRTVSLLLNGKSRVSVQTDGSGNYRGIFDIPYDYVDRLEVRCLYSPEDLDKGYYMAAISPPVILDISYYEGKLDLVLEETAYPGLETTVTGSIDYEDDPVPGQARGAGIYFDDVLVSETGVTESFSGTMRIDSGTATGNHLVMVYLEGMGRYAPILQTSVLRVSRVTPTIEIDAPDFGFIPGSIGLSGRVFSPLGPVSSGTIDIETGGHTTTLEISADGSFSTKAGTGLSFGLIGYDDLVVRVDPAKSWYATTSLTQRILIFNIIGIVILFLILVLAVYFLRNRIWDGFAFFRKQRAVESVPVVDSEISLVYSEMSGALPEVIEGSDEPREKILGWYIRVVRLIEHLTRIMLKPSQTLREFAAETGSVLGPAAGYFKTFTVKVERLLYSRYRPTESDLHDSRELFEELESESKYPDIDTNTAAENQTGETQQ